MRIGRSVVQAVLPHHLGVLRTSRTEWGPAELRAAVRRVRKFSLQRVRHRHGELRRARAAGDIGLHGADRPEGLRHGPMRQDQAPDANATERTRALISVRPAPSSGDEYRSIS